MKPKDIFRVLRVKQSNQKGFTLLEILIAIGILAILAFIAIPQLGKSSYTLDGATRLVWSDMHNARMTAIRENRPIRVEFVNSTSYRFVRVDTGAVIFTRDLATDYPDVTISSSGGTTTFNSRGTVDATTITVSLSGEEKEFTIAWTGRIKTI